MSLLAELWATWSRAICSLPMGGYLQALSLPISMLVAWLTFRAASSNLRYSLLAADVTTQIKDFSESCRKLSKDIEGHYLGQYSDGFSAGVATESRNQILSAVKAINDKRTVLAVFLSTRTSVELQKRFDEWQEQAMGDSFPVTRKKDCCKEYEKPVSDLRKAQSGFDRYLAELRRHCIDDRWRLRRAMR